MHLQKFIDRVQSTEARGLKDVSFTITEARAMHAELTRILLELQSVRKQATQSPSEEVVQISVNGGTFK